VDIIHVHPPLTGSPWAFQVALFALVSLALPLSALALLLRFLTRRDGCGWSSRWRVPFQAGFVIQICSLVVTVPCAADALLSVSLTAATMMEAFAAAVLAASVMGGGLAIPAWRTLMTATAPALPPSIRA
jgi:hypothetical protein